jgi:hypothetical protein
MDAATGLAATIDGVPVQNLTSYRSSSVDFGFVTPDENVLGLPKGLSGRSVADGYYLMLAPLSSGKHTIRIQGSLPAFAFTIDTTFNLTIGR